MVYYGDEVIRFDWAMKRLLRQKANFAVLESFLSELLGEKVVQKAEKKAGLRPFATSRGI